jgi:hypothetical protein
VRQKLIAQMICMIRHELIRKRYDHYTTACTSTNKVTYTTPEDIRNLNLMTIPLRILFPCSKTCVRCKYYSSDKDFEVFNTAAFVSGKRHAGSLLQEIKHLFVQF